MDYPSRWLSKNTCLRCCLSETHGSKIVSCNLYPWALKPMKKSRFETPNIWVQTSKHEGFGFPWFRDFWKTTLFSHHPKKFHTTTLAFEGRYGSGKSYGKAWSQYQETPKVRQWNWCRNSGVHLSESHLEPIPPWNFNFRSYLWV